uniref:Uncharacterized protein n=1 Tax=Parascaris univalens TaxID=6257 RepID=A0A915AHX2_PARUN
MRGFSDILLLLSLFPLPNMAWKIVPISRKKYITNNLLNRYYYPVERIIPHRNIGRAGSAGSFMIRLSRLHSKSTANFAYFFQEILLLPIFLSYFLRALFSVCFAEFLHALFKLAIFGISISFPFRLLPLFENFMALLRTFKFFL